MLIPEKARKLEMLQRQLAGVTTAPVAPDLRSFGVDAADKALGGGIPAAGLLEVRLPQPRGGGCGAGFLTALAVLFGASRKRPFLWIGEQFVFGEAGWFYHSGLAAHGLDPAALAIVRPPRLEQAIWAAEEAVASGAVALVVLELFGNPARMALEGTRRLHMRALAGGTPLVLLRQAAMVQTSAAPLRLRLASAPAALPEDIASRWRLIGNPVFDVEVEKLRGGPPARFRVEWNPHECCFKTCQPHSGIAVPVSADRQNKAGLSGPFVAREPAGQRRWA
ncbi:hypothetical protein [Aureimonas fodinaquatilis]|uniref:ImuA family protein n=1 Tax=Aureimonas fodinaquatilis TaxID=2565783 RepID=UPI00319DC5D7